ncbi:uncharacterized protein GIQ15_02840 [Arthroderma uncinatum]|uniref:uncharacterized protein n=1 Tax=Arthroderma uncinatum TaxID=74035 RepID=UPI00144ADD02|nr:uncharacterized protein GIQ15_02840 [Arthroderma uncinatum]KAF3483516.1 hypothetical protein GIQ15_02840 [Arthroderma uncinatum]
MDPATFVDPNLTQPDLLVLKCLLRDIDEVRSKQPSLTTNGNGHANGSSTGSSTRDATKEAASFRGPSRDDIKDDKETIEYLKNLNDPAHDDFDPTVFVTWDTQRLPFPAVVQQWLIRPYIAMARKLVRVETDVAMFSHLQLYFTTSVPSAILLFYHFTWVHGILHWLMQSWYMGTYTLMMHQHIHMGGVLSRKLWLVDYVFPYITNPLMGHTWNSYYYHHVKHHHVEGNGPEDRSSTLRYQRDELVDFLAYVGRFLFLVWIDLPVYFLTKGKYVMAGKAAFWEMGNYAVLISLFTMVNARATVFVFLLPLLLMRIGMMVGNWGQHALVDEIDPTSDYRSSITLVDVPSNRFCFNDGYHTSHHLNPRRHWRDHPVAFLSQKARYSNEQALVFRNIDYIMMTVKLLQKDYMHLAKCLVPIGEEQINMSMEQRAGMLKRKTRKFSEEEISKLYGKA